jgi:tetratricopeptide (TPR) repeat protein
MAEINIDATGRYGNMSVNDVAFTLEKAYKCEIMSRQGRVLLQAGAIYEATQIFDLARNTWSDEIEPTLGTLGMEVKDHPVLKGLPSLMKVNEGLSFFSKSRYDRALQCFTTAIDNLRKQDRIHPQYRVEDWVGPSIATCIEHSTLYSESVGNMALCHLYECRMEEAVALMEGLIREDPTAFLTERVIFNLCTLYELGSDSTVGTRKKRVLQLIAKRFFLHDVGPESFRIN